MEMLTYERATQLLSYDPDTGDLFWNVVSGERGRSVYGRKAGTKNTRGYIDVRLSGRFYKAHRLAVLLMTGSWPVSVVDHINRVKSDNRWSNLRCVTQQENALNSERVDRSLGVYFHKKSGSWEAKGMLNGCRKYLGRFRDLDAAVSARTEFLDLKSRAKL